MDNVAVKACAALQDSKLHRLVSFPAGGIVTVSQLGVACQGTPTSEHFKKLKALLVLQPAEHIRKIHSKFTHHVSIGMLSL